MRPMETKTGRTLETPGGPGSGCKVRGCCMGIPIGCGTLAVLALLLGGVFTAGRNVQDRQDRQEQTERQARRQQQQRQPGQTPPAPNVPPVLHHPALFTRR